MDYDNLYDLIQERTGMMLDEHRRDKVRKALGTLLEPTGHNLLPKLLEYPPTHSLWQELIHAITIGETYFFRNKAQLNALRMDVLPELISQRRSSGNQQLRFWSAGCATGEEAYSLAMLLRELIPDIDYWSITILATDINLNYLKYAREGVYRSNSFRGETPEVVRERWFTPEDNGYRLHPAVRKMVTFAPLNLVTSDYPSFENGTMNLDLIMCRNVTIYFDREVIVEIIPRFYQALHNTGWLVVGHSETVTDIHQGFVPCNFKNAVLYQKQDMEVDTPLPPPVIPANPVKPPPSLPLPKPRPKLPPVVKPKPPPQEEKQQPQEESPLEEALRLARYAADHEHWDEAMEWLDKAEKEDRLQPQVHYLRALVHLQNGENAAAILALRRSVYCDPDFAMAHYTLSELYEKQGNYKEAARHCRQARAAIDGLDPQQKLSYTEDLTVEMLRALLKQHIQLLSKLAPGEYNDVDL